MTEIERRFRERRLTNDEIARERGLTHPLYCSWCGKSEKDVLVLIAGPTVFICDECVSLCSDIVADRKAHTPFIEGNVST